MGLIKIQIALAVGRQVARSAIKLMIIGRSLNS